MVAQQGPASAVARARPRRAVGPMPVLPRPPVRRIPARDARLIALAWLLTRAACLVLLLVLDPWVLGDVRYYADSFGALPRHGLSDTLVEYPLPAVALLAVPWVLAHVVAAEPAFTGIVITLLLVPDAALTWLLARRRHPGRRTALAVWLVAPVLLGATSFARFDLVPGVLAALALLLVQTRPRVGAAAGAIAITLKLWPAVLLPALFLGARRRLSAATAVAVVGGLAVVVTVVLGGPARLLSPLLWQSDRGLQIESVAATPAILGWAFGPGDYLVGMSVYHADEVRGTGVPALAEASAIATLLGLVLLVGLFAAAWRRRASLSVDALVWCCLAAVLTPIVTSKVLSPQYLLWVLPLTAVAHVLVRRPADVRALRRWTAGMLLATLATQVEFPLNYGTLLDRKDGVALVVLDLAVRNAVLVGLLVVAWRHAVRHLRGR